MAEDTGASARMRRLGAVSPLHFTHGEGPANRVPRYDRGATLGSRSPPHGRTNAALSHPPEPWRGPFRDDRHPFRSVSVTPPPDCMATDANRTACQDSSPRRSRTSCNGALRAMSALTRSLACSTAPTPRITRSIRWALSSRPPVKISWPRSRLPPSTGYLSCREAADHHSPDKPSARHWSSTSPRCCRGCSRSTSKEASSPWSPASISMPSIAS